MLKNILKLDAVKQLTKKEQKETKGTGGINSGGTNNISTSGPILSPDDPDYWKPGGKFACYTRYKNPNSFSHISNTDETGSVYICFPY